MFKILNRFYNELHVYTKEDVAKFVKLGKISADEYKDITGEDYAE